MTDIAIDASARFRHAVTGATLNAFQVDGNATVGLPDATGRPWFEANARGFVSIPSYDSMHRLTATTVALRASDAVTVAARTGYGESLPLDQAQALNARGRAVEEFSQDGWAAVGGNALSGLPCAVVRHLCRAYAAPDDGMPAVAVPPLTGSVPAGNLLQSVGYSSALQRHDALGRQLEVIDPVANILRRQYRISGLLDSVSAGNALCLSAFVANARGQVVSFARGESRCTSSFRHDPKTWSVIRRQTGSDDGEARQDIRYAFDPCGNVLGVEDACPVIVSGNDGTACDASRYDALYRLLEATGMESPAASPIDGTPSSHPAHGGSALSPYLQRYAYDDGGNVTGLRHFSGKDCDASRSTAMAVSSASNRSLPAGYLQQLGGTAIDEAFLEQQGLFDACGNQLKTQDLQAIAWDYRNQAVRVAYPDPEDSSRTVTEYGTRSAGGGTRSRKVVETRDAGGVLARLETVVVLGDLELHVSYAQASDAGIVYDGETATNAIAQGSWRQLRIGLGHAQQVRIVDGAAAPGSDESGGIEEAEQRWHTLGDQLDSCRMELDDEGNVANWQGFYPYGGTSAAMASDGSLATKTRQYSGEEKDGSGLIHYGFRLYKPFDFSWLSPDPSGLRGSGLNWYRMVDGNPASFRDHAGLTRHVSCTDANNNPHLLRIGDLNDFNRDLTQRFRLNRTRKIVHFFADDHRRHEVATGLFEAFVTRLELIRRPVTVHMETFFWQGTHHAQVKSRPRPPDPYSIEQWRFYRNHRWTVRTAEPLQNFLATRVPITGLRDVDGRRERMQGIRPRDTFGSIVGQYVYGENSNEVEDLHILSYRGLGDHIARLASPLQLRYTRGNVAVVAGLLHMFETGDDDDRVLRLSAGFTHYRSPSDYGLINRVPNSIGVFSIDLDGGFTGSWDGLHAFIQAARDRGHPVGLYELVAPETANLRPKRLGGYTAGQRRSVIVAVGRSR